MKFGTIGYIRRGSDRMKPGEKGCTRYVKVKLIGGKGNQVKCTLLEDDLLSSVGPNLCGEKGEWSKSCFVKTCHPSLQLSWLTDQDREQKNARNRRKRRRQQLGMVVKQRG